MIHYCVTVEIEADVEAEWYQWMIGEHIPDVLQTGYFHKAQICGVLEHGGDWPCYQIRYLCDSIERYQEYEAKASDRLRADHQAKFSGKFRASRHLIEPKVSIHA